MDDWLVRLKQAYDAGYYKTEVDAEQQTEFPWQNRECRDCPFYLVHGRCQIDLKACAPGNVPCAYYDPPDFPEARAIIEERLAMGWRKIWRWEE